MRAASSPPWTTVLSWNEDHGGYFGPPGELVVLNLDPFIGAATEFVLRWHYYDPNAGNDATGLAAGTYNCESSSSTAMPRTSRR